MGIALAAQLLLGMGETPLALLDSHCFFDKAPPFELEEVANLNDLGARAAWPNGADRTESSDDFAGRFQSRFGVTWSRVRAKVR